MSTPTPRTEMKCVRCGGFSSTRVCYHCSNLPDAILFSRVEQLETELQAAREGEQHHAARARVIDQLEESLKTGFLLGNFNEPLDAYGKRLLRVILVEFDRAIAAIKP